MALEAFTTAIDWLRAEREVYQKEKWNYDLDMQRVREDPDYWIDQVGMYLHRAKVLGVVDNPLGRQAVAKAAATAVAYLEATFSVCNEIPAPGFSSGEIHGTMSLRGSHEKSIFEAPGEGGPDHFIP